MKTARCALAIAAAGLLLGACTVMPVGPSVMALPGSTKTVEQYQADAAACQQYAGSIIATGAGGTAATADNRAASTAAAGTVMGAATGAIIGAASGSAGQGAAIGAGMGLLFGAAAGSGYPAMSSYQLQRAYDSVYLQCMYSSGNRVPAPRSYSAAPSRPTYSYSNATQAAYPPADAPPPSAPSGSGYPPPSNVPPSGYPPPDAPAPANLPPRR